MAEREKAETIQAEARLIWKECKTEFELDPGKIEKAFIRFVADKIAGRRRQSAKEAKSEYLEKTLGDVVDGFLASGAGQGETNAPVVCEPLEPDQAIDGLHACRG